MQNISQESTDLTYKMPVKIKALNLRAVDKECHLAFK